MILNQTYKYTVIFFLFAISLFTAKAQKIELGNKLPDMLFHNVINFSKDSINLYDFNSKLTILDFWGTGCLTCIHAFPKMDSIQRKFKDKIQIIAINKESKDSTLRFLAKHKRIRLPALVPFVTGDSILSQYFPHVFVPHHVWIDSNRIVISVTYGQNTTVSNIDQFLNKQHLELTQKTDSLLINNSESDFGLAQLAKDNGALSYYSYITKYMAGVHGSESIASSDTNGKINKIQVESSPVLNLYKIAFGEWRKHDFSLHSNTVKVQLRNSEKYQPPSNINELDQWNIENRYSYGLMVPPDKADQLFRIMQQDLERYFGIRAKIVKRKIDCFVLLKKNKSRKINSHNSSNSDSLNLSFQRFLWLLKLKIDFEATPEPFINQTGIKKDFTMVLNAENWELWDTNHLVDLQKELDNYGLELRKEKRITSVLTIQ